MYIFIWIALGLISGSAAVVLVPRHSSVLGTISLSVLGAVLGGVISKAILMEERITLLNLVVFPLPLLYSLLLLALQRAIVRD